MKKLVVIICALFLFVEFTIAQDKENKKVLVLGSSMSAGWVTSYKEKFDMQNGYAYRLARYLKPQNWDVINAGVPGNTTADVLKRMDETIDKISPKYVVIGLSMSNEGLETDNPDSVFYNYKNGLKKIIDKLQNRKIKPIIGLCYSNNNYTPKQYEYIKKMNLLINKWNYPSINLLGAIDNDSGHFPKNFVFDPNHPNDRGHEEFFFSISPGMFKSMEDNKAFPKEIIHNEAIELGKKSKHKKITYVPNHVIHSYTFMFSFKTEFNSKISSIKSFKNNNEISINEKGNIIYTSGNKSFKSKERITKRKWNKIAVSHRYLFSETHIFLNGSLILKISEQNEPVLFKIEQNKRTITYKDIYLYRTALNKTDINAITGGQFLHAGLDLYSPLNDKKLIVNSKIKNYALNDNYAVINSKNDDHKLKAIRGKIIEFNELRKNELKVKYKEPISINKKLYDKYVGNYEIAPGDYFEILKKDDKLYFADRGQETEIFPEAENKFFIKYPAELTIEFISNEKNEVAEMIFNFNGRKMKAQKK